MFTLHEQLQHDSHLVEELELSQLRLMNDSQYPWLILVPQREAIREICQMTEPDQALLLAESNLVSRMLIDIHQPDKLNIAAIGNVVPQLHLHHVARFSTDATWPAPIWGRLPLKPYPPEELSTWLNRYKNHVNSK